LRSVLPKQEFCFVSEKNVSSNETGRSHRYVQQRLKESTVVVRPYHLSPTPSTAIAMKTPDNTEEGPDDPEPADE